MQISNVTSTENEIFVEWDLQLPTPIDHFSIELTTTYEGPCPSVSIISGDTVNSTTSNHTFTGLEAFSNYTVTVHPLLEGVMLIEEANVRTLPSGKVESKMRLN